MKIAVGLSGGVDSSVAALLLKQQGHEVIGLFMQNWHNTTGTLHGQCLWEDDWELAQMVAHKLDIPVHFIDLSQIYRQRVVDYMFAEYEKGRTPNPDVLCNREIKFDAFLEKALELGVEKVATGHYCQLDRTPGGLYRLLAGADPNKDQSYFLCQLSQAQLSYACFPIGHLLKPQVRQLAAQAQLPTATRKDSQGICFVGKVDLPVFLQQKLAPKEGPVVEVFRDGSQKTIGTHQGAHYYTIGQRKGLHIGGHKEPLFVLETNIETNTIYVGEGQDHPGLYRSDLYIRPDEVHWIRPDLALSPGQSQRFRVRIRYRQPLQDATLTCLPAAGAPSPLSGAGAPGPLSGAGAPSPLSGAAAPSSLSGAGAPSPLSGAGAPGPLSGAGAPGGLHIHFDQPQRGITQGQFAAWYLPAAAGTPAAPTPATPLIPADELIGSGVIA